MPSVVITDNILTAYRLFEAKFKRCTQIVVKRKEFQINTMENMLSKTCCSHFSQEGPINLIPSLDCYICIAIFKDTHISYPDSICWPYCPIAIFTYDFMASLLVNKGKSYKDVTIW